MKMIHYFVLIISVSLFLGLFASCSSDDTSGTGTGGDPDPDPTGKIIVDHSCCDIDAIPQSAIETAKANLIIAYGHTSHGSQLVTGMTGLITFKGSLYDFNSDGSGGALQLRDTPFSGASDLGNPDWTAWAGATRTYLDTHTDVNVVIWSWCGEVSAATEDNINTYLGLMNALESDYPDVTFVYMTGHLDGTGLTGNLHIRNEQIREYCRTYGKTLYDFADIETYDPNGCAFCLFRPPYITCTYCAPSLYISDVASNSTHLHLGAEVAPCVISRESLSPIIAARTTFSGGTAPAHAATLVPMT